MAGARARHEVQRDIRLKERARDALAKRYRSATLPEARPPLCLPLGIWCMCWRLPCIAVPWRGMELQPVGTVMQP